MSSESVTRLLDQARAGDTRAREKLFQVVYTELRALATRHMRRERQDHTLQPTALVHEAYLRLFEEAGPAWTGRTHFFAIASTQMRHILVDYARRHRAQKRGGAARAITLTDCLAYSQQDAEELLALDEGLTRLAAIQPDAARVVEMTFFGGMTQQEAAEVLGCSERTVKRQWAFARGYLLDELSRSRR
jgi:RNA polymerase sigma factor (TIGR02999 family)